ncbi:helix-turn-helix domain-containing protein [Leifsonia sp. Root112D2]|uniref:helix-turn-helix domain-containing protein n=1 Tax=Leifsonia sp. Root112D2 TaxID=1736426 RepID=UPI0009E9B0CF|nr:helix-turn-helix domain-containing protein [Leifsonia sp. Root112D2]
MSLREPHHVQAVDAGQAAEVGKRLELLAASGAPLRLVVGDAEVELPASVREAVVDLLQRVAAGDNVVIASTESLLTTSQAAEMIGISHTYLLRLADGGKLPVQYRGTHRRFALADVVRYVEAAAEERARGAATAEPTNG